MTDDDPESTTVADLRERIEKYEELGWTGSAENLRDTVEELEQMDLDDTDLNSDVITANLEVGQLDTEELESNDTDELSESERLERRALELERLGWDAQAEELRQHDS